MRSRSLKPGFFKNEDLAALPPLIRVLFAGLWGCADREGRLEDRPKRIKAEVLPYDDCDCDTLLDELAAAPTSDGRPFIIRYEVEGRRLIWLPTFLDHQSPHKTERASDLPAYMLEMQAKRELTVNAPLNNGDNTVRQHPRARVLTPSSLTPDSCIPTTSGAASPVEKSPREVAALKELRSLKLYPYDEEADLALLRERQDSRVDLANEVRRWVDYHRPEWEKWRKKNPPNYRLSWRNWLTKAHEFMIRDHGPEPPTHAPAELPPLQGDEVPMPESVRALMAGILKPMSGAEQQERGP